MRFVFTCDWKYWSFGVGGGKGLSHDTPVEIVWFFGIDFGPLMFGIEVLAY